MQAVTARARELLHTDLPDIYGALRREAIKGSFQHIKLALEMTGQHTDKLQIDWRQALPDGYEPSEVQKQFTELLRQAANADND